MILRPVSHTQYFDAQKVNMYCKLVMTAKKGLITKSLKRFCDFVTDVYSFASDDINIYIGTTK